MSVQPFHEFIPNWGMFHVRIGEVERLEQRSARVDATIVISGVLKSIGTRYGLLGQLSTRRIFWLVARYVRRHEPNTLSRNLHSR